ncbi:AMIN-like domain-containing (lipo)protein [Dactylosporangium fulvum]
MPKLRTLFALLVLAPVFALPGTGAAAGDLPAPTSVTPQTGTATVPPWDPHPPTLVGVRTGRHEHYDRTVFDFTGGTPGYRVEYGSLVSQATGTTLPVDGAATLVVVFDGAYPYDVATGASTVDLGTVHNPRLPTLRQIRSGGAVEGKISFGLGLADRVGFRVLRLTNPPRIAVDVAHQPTQPFTTERFRGGAGTASQVRITSVRTGAHPGYDRVVFDLGTATAPLISVAYAVAAPTTIHVGFTAATTQPGAVAGPNPVPIGLTQARSVSFAVYDNGTVSAFVTTHHRTGYRVMLLTNPTRVVVDVAY